MRILVTGGAGFIGRWVVGQLLRQRHEVWIVDDFSSGNPENIREFEKDRRLRDVLRLDIRNGARLERCVWKIRPQQCYHLAAQVNVQTSLAQPKRTYEVNVLGTQHLLEALRRIKSGLLLAGTCLVYQAARNKKISETSPTQPLSPYAGSKLAAEELALGYAHGYHMPVTIVRPFNTYGPYQRADAEGGVVSIFIGRHLKNQPVFIYGTGFQTRDFLYVEDCAEFIVRAGKYRKTNGEIFNAGTGLATSIRSLAKQIAGKDAVRFVKHHHPQAEIYGMACDCSKAKIKLGWSPAYGLDEGIRRTAQWLRSGPRLRS
ncbi:MAG: GDP-mannose 4,6-dehydratase [Candidatus Omnitrophica bacterium]|nr:GDP-mannose 4,6-dehydratase [Candidatus Omnitrophota bacterium]